MPESRRLTRLQRRFCELVNAGMSGAAAMRTLRPELADPKSRAHILRKMPHVRAYLEELDSRAIEEAAVTRTFVLQQLRAVAGFDPRQLFNDDGSMKAIKDLDAETAAAIASIETDEVFANDINGRTRCQTKKVRNWQKTEALRILAQILGMTKEQLQLTGTIVRVIDMTGAKTQGDPPDA
jgi:hypothetical protein